MMPMNHNITSINIAQYPYRFSSGTETLSVINSSLIGFKIHATREKPCLVLETQLTFYAGEIMGIRGESTTTNLLKQHNP